MNSLPLPVAEGAPLSSLQSGYMAERLVSQIPGLAMVIAYVLRQNLNCHQIEMLPGIQQWGGCIGKNRENSGESARDSDEIIPGLDESGLVKDVSVADTKGGQEPPPPPADKPDPSPEQKALDDFDLLLEQFGEQLKELKDEGIFVVFETDLDDTLVQNLGDQYEFSNEVAHKLELKRMEKFSNFAQSYSDSFILVYNTARTPTGAFSSNSPQLFREIGVEDSDTFEGSQREGMIFNALDEAHTRSLLPIPDILIMELGSVIQSNWLTEETGMLTNSECYTLSETLLDWTEDDRDELEKMKPHLQKHFANIGYTHYHSSLKFSSSNRTPAWSAVQQDVTHFHEVWPNSPVAFVPSMNFSGSQYVNNGRASLASVNKGSTFRLVLEKIIDRRRAQSKSTQAMVFIFGDTALDLSMLRPDLEIEAFELIGSAATNLRDVRFQTQGVMPLHLSDLSWWELSIVPTKSELGRGKCCGTYVDRVLSHPKITKSTGWGLTSLIEKVVGYLKHRIPEPLDEIPIPQGFFDAYL